MKTRAVYIAGSARIPFVKSMTDYRDVQTQDLMIASLQRLVDTLQLSGRTVGDVGLGAVINSSMNWNLAREAVLGTTLNPDTPAYTLQRACGTSLETTLQIALKIANYQMDDGIAGGVDSNSDLPVMFRQSFTRILLKLNEAKTPMQKIKAVLSFKPSHFKPQYPSVKEPRTGLSMGEHTEKMVKQWRISRKDQDQLAWASHQKAARAYDEGFYDDLVFDFKGLHRDGTLRPDTTLDKLEKLKPAFDKTVTGTLTAGNSTPLTDGSSAVYLVSEDIAKQHRHPLLARFVDAQVAAVDFVHGEGLLMAPTRAVYELLYRNGLKLQDFDFYEIHEAFAGQVLCTLKAWESEEYCRNVLRAKQALGPIDQSKMNIKGGSLALGHPFAATGTRIVGTLAKLLHQKGSGRGLISICTAGGMGVAAILEAV
ncbi:acetyl-CoA C-acetyltransferase [Legionella taurinensis]|uniref:Acetyl-CoA C-acetyltransferase n=1 Tax=Legionella taurinensis TaxID=70611 RepID=A0AB38N6V7_9GAMM|nr:acetyl-CoA C-acetyltransferase [Legionella taurinensis]MDX1837100.1 acetyl-CoA C-acetyltransferase [Legionella taurinensis]PUT40414.1 acetyl-CoA C-acetyltransferase [Legionella taurinensis]PUT40494.1 acetyl-CoA C-acetyltransferase [Legionella taurinensis]PUT42739.1 acetyl-CoA C-acetyltransferase [Legionella taurinensis]PUT48476.1 acetyl-CoA C-acetyltransferase [Legionella taurinensis]